MKKILVLLLLFFPLVSSASFDRDLYFGLKADTQVTELQDFLTEQGVYSGPITGNFYSLTLKAVKTFQAANNISPISGYVGPLTRGKANAVLASQGIDNGVTNESGIITNPATTSPKTTDDVVAKLNDQIAILMKQIEELQKQQATLGQIQTQQVQQQQTLTQIQQNTTPPPAPVPIPPMSPQPTPVPTPPPPPPTEFLVNGTVPSSTLTNGDVIVYRAIIQNTYDFPVDVSSVTYKMTKSEIATTTKFSVSSTSSNSGIYLKMENYTVTASSTISLDDFSGEKKFDVNFPFTIPAKSIRYLDLILRFLAAHTGDTFSSALTAVQVSPPDITLKLPSQSFNFSK